MTALIKHPSVHAGKLERYLGAENVEHISRCMKPWYGRPIGLGYVPGKVYAGADGDFSGRIQGGLEVSAREIASDFWERGKRGLKAVDPAQVNSAFASLSDFIAQFSTPSNRRTYPLNKIGAAGTTNATGSLWQSAGWPPAGAAGSAAPGGRAPDNTTTGSWPFNNSSGGSVTQKFVAAYINGSVINCTLMLYDRLFDVAKTMSSSTTEAVSGVPTRYQSTTTTADDYAGDNFIFIETQATLSATAHNWTICQYTNQAGTTLQTLPSVTGISSCAAQRLDQPLGTWFCPLATGDLGIKALTQMQCSASVTGSINFVIGHPIAWIPGVAVAAAWSFTDGATTAFARIFDSACLALLEPVRPTSSACTYSGAIYGCMS